MSISVFKKINFYEILRLTIIIFDFLILQFTHVEKLETLQLIFLVLLNFSLIVIIVWKLRLTRKTGYGYSAQSIFYGSIASGIFSIMIFGNYLLN